MKSVCYGWCLCFLFFVSAAQSEIMLTPRQQAVVEALDGNTAFDLAWRKRGALLVSVEPALHTFAAMRGCGPRPMASRFEIPAYLQYVETVGAEYLRYLRTSGAEMLRRKADVWAIDQLTGAQYAELMTLLTSADTLRARELLGAGAAFSQSVENIVDTASGRNNTALLLAFKESADQAKLSSFVGDAIGQDSPEMAQVFLSLRSASGKDEEELAMWMQLFGEEAVETYWKNIPADSAKHIAAVREGFFAKYQRQAIDALALWQKRQKGLSDMDPSTYNLSEQERLGQRIDVYFGDVDSPEFAALENQVYGALAEASANYLNLNKESMCGK